MLKNLTSNKRGQEQPTNGKDAILSEIRRCKSDPAYFARNYVFIKDKQKGAIKFKLWEFQEKALRDFQNNRLNIVLKARQLGMTELMAMYVLWFAMFQRDKTVVIVSKHRKAASDLVKRVKYAYKKLPQWLKVTKLVSDNVHTVEFDNDSVIFADSSSENAGRGIACSLFIVDEAAFIPTLEEMWAAVFPSIDSGGSCIVSSTPNGSAGQFYNLYQEAPKNGFNPIKLDWDSRPDRDQEWYEKTRLSMSPKKFSQEFLCSFLLSGDTVIDGEDIERHEQNVKKFGSNRKEIGPAKDVWVWKEYNHMHRYCLGADVARGDGEDYSAFTILDFDTGEIVCEYKGKIKVDRFAELLITCANNYGQCLIIVENNSYGLAVLMKLIDFKYPSIYWEEKGTKQYRDGYVDFNNDDDAVPGFTTTQRSRFAIVDNLEESFRTNRITTYSQRMISEMRNFIYENGKPKARKGSNDDLIMALSITLFIASMIFSSREEDYEMKRRLLDNFRLLENQASIKVSGEIGYNKDKNLLQVDENDPYKYKFRNETIDFRMLIGNSESKKKEEPIVNQGIIFLGYIK